MTLYSLAVCPTFGTYTRPENKERTLRAPHRDGGKKASAASAAGEGAFGAVLHEFIDLSPAITSLSGGTLDVRVFKHQERLDALRVQSPPGLFKNMSGEFQTGSSPTCSPVIHARTRNIGFGLARTIFHGLTSNQAPEIRGEPR